MQSQRSHRHSHPPFEFDDRRSCMEARLVLESAGIGSHAYQQHHRWWLAVADENESAAAAELNAYELEKAESPAVNKPKRTELFGGAMAGVFAYAVILISFFLLADVSAYQINWSLLGQMQADKVTGGQWWRCVTALTLHVDGSHLISNLGFGAVFGLLAGRILGGGVAWLTIVLAGTLGNAINAFVRDPEHVSIGASTAVFAALGIMVAHALRPPALDASSAAAEKWQKRWSPLIGGVLLLAMLGIGGERTDVVAHVTGFLSGVLIGWFGCRLPTRVLASSTIQCCAAMAAMALIAFAWSLSITSPVDR
ncbi:rhomboid family intramembrane serine protease [Novipirellula aureliae]|nr:rhomboid family intramembrane serine protease [Novipirellula aureliae]